MWITWYTVDKLKYVNKLFAESNNYSRIIEDLLNKISVTKDENPGGNEEDNKVEILEEDYSNFDINSEDDKAIMDIFNSIPD